MKFVLRLFGLLAFVLVFGGTLSMAADLNGAWKGVIDVEGNNLSITFNLKVDGSAIAGTVKGLSSSPIPIRDGKLEGDSVTFRMNVDYEGETYEVICKGKIVNDQINFNIETTDGSFASDMTVKRASAPAPPDLSGVWKGTFDFEGTSVPIILHLKGDGTVVVGTMEGLPTSPTDIHDGKIDGNTVTFWVNTDYEGQNYKIVCTGRIDAEQINFTIGTDDGGWQAALIAKKS